MYTIKVRNHDYSLNVTEYKLMVNDLANDIIVTTMEGKEYPIDRVLEPNLLELTIDEVISYIKDNCLDAEELGLELDEDEVISEYFESHDFEDLMDDDTFEISDIIKYLNSHGYWCRKDSEE